MIASADIILTDDVITGSGPYTYNYIASVDGGGLWPGDALGSRFDILGIPGYVSGSAAISDIYGGTTQDWLVTASSGGPGLTNLRFTLTDLDPDPIPDGTDFANVSFRSIYGKKTQVGTYTSTGFYGPSDDGGSDSSLRGVIDIPAGPGVVPEASTVVSMAAFGLLAAGYTINRRRQAAQ